MVASVNSDGLCVVVALVKVEVQVESKHRSDVMERESGADGGRVDAQWIVPFEP